MAPSHFNTTNKTAKAKAWEIHNAALKVGQLIASLNPDVIILSTPHGISAPDDFVFYLSPQGYGSADTDNCVCPPCCYNLSVPMDTEVTSKIVDFLKGSNNVTFLSAFGPPGKEDVPFPLRWGEIVPIYFSKEVLSKTKFVFLSHPSHRYTDDVIMIPELYKLGSNLRYFVDSLNKSVAIVISADLAHTHLKSGPYGFSTAAEPFDKACGKWVTSQDSKVLLVEAAGYVDKALSCGYTGFVMLDGMLKSGTSIKWKSHLYVNEHPSYYGMMVASFIPQK